MPTAVAELPVPIARRMSLDPAARLGSRQVAWVSTQVGASALLTVAGPSPWPELAVLPLALGAAATLPRRAFHAVGMVVASMAAAVLVGGVADGPTTLSSWISTTPSAGAPVLHGEQILAAAAVVGAGLAWLDGGPPSLWRRLHGALATVTAVGLGGWAAARLLPPDWLPVVAALATAAVVALLASQSLTLLAVRHHASARVPTREVIAQTLGEAHRSPALMAWQLDQDLAGVSPDLDTRDGLGEVAAWIYRLQSTRQQLERERDRVGGPGVEERIVEMTTRAATTDDDFTRDRLLATVDHLQRLRGHRAALEAEVDRAAALCDYATAFLEEARAELTLARVQPGDASPTRLPDVLSRLRTYSARQTLERETHRELVRTATAALGVIPAATPRRRGSQHP